MKTLTKSLVWVLSLLILGGIVALIMPVFQSARFASLVLEPKSHLHTYASSTLQYASDYDQRLPNPSSQPSARAMIAEYGYRDFAWSYHPANFNLNTSGVNLSTIDMTDPNLVFWYLIPTKSEFPIITNDFQCDSQFVDPSQFFSMLGKQFDRPGVTLAPADYLADQDPLKK